MTHQVYQIDAESRAFRTQGIANIASDGSISPDAAPVPYENLVGKPVACIPVSGLHQQIPHFSAGSCDCRDGYRRFIIASIAAGKLAALDSGQAASHRGGGGQAQPMRLSIERQRAPLQADARNERERGALHGSGSKT